jgi:hypothetical protein
METSAERLLLTVEGLIGRQHLASSIATSVGVLLASGNHRKNDVPHAHSPKWRGVTARPTAGLARGHPSRVLAFALVDLEQLERVSRERSDALGPAPARSSSTSSTSPPTGGAGRDAAGEAPRLLSVAGRTESRCPHGEPATRHASVMES